MIWPEVILECEMSNNGFGGDLGVGETDDRVVKKYLVFSATSPLPCGDCGVGCNFGGGEDNTLDDSGLGLLELP